MSRSTNALMVGGIHDFEKCAQFRTRTLLPTTVFVFLFLHVGQGGALVALSKHCPRLVSLNVALIGHVTDVGVSALSRGCRSLQALNIAGAKEVSQRMCQTFEALHSFDQDMSAVELFLFGEATSSLSRRMFKCSDDLF